MSLEEKNLITQKISCNFFVKRKKRYCRITPAKNEIYCGEHLPLKDVSLNSDLNHIRVVCPLDPKHTVYEKNMKKHLKICNAAVKEVPSYIVPGLNAGQYTDVNIKLTESKLSNMDGEARDKLINKVNDLYKKFDVDKSVSEMILQHHSLEEELSNEQYGKETKKHLIQTSAIIGYLEHYNLLKDNTSYVEFGAGRGQVSYFLAQAISSYTKSNVLLIDRAAVRYKKDNKLDESLMVKRIRADIADFDITNHDLVQCSNAIIGVGKHLCGAATDFAIRCVIHGNEKVKESDIGPKTEAIIIALCCHHRCEWTHFVGKDFFTQNHITPEEFGIITKMVGWAVCGTGMSRERRNEQLQKRAKLELSNEELENHEERSKRKEIGIKCKRLIDYARLRFLEENGFNCYIQQYVPSDITLENVCLVALMR